MVRGRFKVGATQTGKKTMNRYLLSIFQPAVTHPDPEVLGTIMADVGALIQELEASDVLVLNAGLAAPDTAKVARFDAGDVLTTDGAFVETKEHLGGFVVVSTETEEEALEWGRKLSRATTLPIEIRSFAVHAGN